MFVRFLPFHVINMTFRHITRLADHNMLDKLVVKTST